MLAKVFAPIPARFNIGVCLFFACFISYMLRTNISISLIAMVEDNKNSSSSIVNSDNRYPWTSSEQALILGGFFYGYLVTQVFGGLMAERFGGKHVVGVSLLLSGIINCLTPLLLKLSSSYLTLLTGRIVLGILGGTVFPALHNLVACWAPPAEKGRFVAALLGGALGNVVTWMMLGVLIENYGWEIGFYVTSIFTFVFIAMWYYFVADSPAKHPRISLEERNMIKESIGSSLSTHKTFPPLVGLLTSLPFIALTLLHYGSLWGLYFLQTAAPKFMTEVLDFNLAKAGYFSSLPPLARLICGFGFGSLGDMLRRKDIFSVTVIRKSFCLFSHIVPGLFLLTISYLTFDPYICVGVVTLSMGFNGAATMTNLQNAQDLAPNFAGTLYGIINFVGTTSGFISPLIVAYFTEDESTISTWKYVFWIGAAAYIIPAFIFILLGTGAIQKWNDIKNPSIREQ